MDYGDTIRVFKMIKKDDGTFTFKAAAEDFPKKHIAPILNIGIAETGIHCFIRFCTCPVVRSSVRKAAGLLKYTLSAQVTTRLMKV